MFPLLIEVNIYASYSVGLVFGVPTSSKPQYWPFVLHCWSHERINIVEVRLYMQASDSFDKQESFLIRIYST